MVESVEEENDRYPNDVILILVPPTKREQILALLRENFPYLDMGPVGKRGKCYVVV